MLILVLLVSFVATAIALFLVWAPLKQSIDRSSSKARDEMTQRLDEMFIFIPVEYLGTVRLGCSGVFGVCGFLLAFNAASPGPFVAAGAGAVIGFFFPQLLVAYLRRRRRKQFSEQLTDGLILLANGLRANLSMQQSIEMLVEESPAPLCQEFDLVMREHRLGVDLDKAIVNCAQRTRDEDLALAATAFSVTRQLGGNIAEIFDRIVNMIKARKLLKGKVDALTAQGRMQAMVVAAMPYVFGFFGAKANPELMSLLWTTIPGFCALGLVVILDTLGYLWVIKITKVKY
jgi:tight adherence protein B